MIQHPWMIIIYGPTGVGKSDFAIEFARALQATQISVEIINADVGQFYVPISIGTAKPDWKASDIPHHLFDVIDEPRDFTVTKYRKSLLEIANEIWQRNHMPMIVGGSGFYISSMFFPPESSLEFASDMEFPDDTQELWQHLYEIDPQRALEIHPHDKYRIGRALEIWKKTGKKPSEFKPSYDPPAPYFLLCLNRDRDDLYQRINARVVQMFEQGWIEEVERIKGTPWENFLKEKKLIGYDDIVRYLDNENTVFQDPSKRNKTELIEAIARKTRNYAKRQMIFWKMLEKKIKSSQANEHNSIIETINLTSSDLDVYLNRLVKTIKKLKEGKHV